MIKKLSYYQKTDSNYGFEIVLQWCDETRRNVIWVLHCVSCEE